ncbi:hypothetical protein LCGC14_2626210 [marine sediment metagenome]|uniref:Uncharacterized protein n=1 Tax=marine sediment metagenome TaxID=412755 RepID=A0A0F9A1J1_9ZZZZ
MGTDCKIIVDDKIIGLDRWYVFSDYFKNGKEYSKEEAIKGIIYLFEHMPDTDSHIVSESKFYHSHWIVIAENEIKKAKHKVMFLADFDDRYFEKSTGGITQ